MSMPVPLKERPLDLLYVSFFLIHIPATLLIDIQSLYPPARIPSALKSLIDKYIDVFNDPLISGVMGHWSSGSWTWLLSFMWLEALFQLPTFILGIINLSKDNKKFYPWLLIYGASTATTVLACLSTLLTTPAGPTSIRGVQMDYSQRALLLGSYIPFLVIPLVMTIDMAFRISKLVSVNIKTENARKTQ